MLERLKRILRTESFAPGTEVFPDLEVGAITLSPWCGVSVVTVDHLAAQKVTRSRNRCSFAN